jgi:hypothetical protein
MSYELEFYDIFYTSISLVRDLACFTDERVSFDGFVRDLGRITDGRVSLIGWDECRFA